MPAGTEGGDPGARGGGAWRPDPAALEAALAAGRPPGEPVCLGCAAKADLVRVVYPALARLSREVPAGSPVRFEPRDDVYVFETDGDVRLDRRTYPLSDLTALEAAAARDVRALAPGGAVLLASFCALPREEEFSAAMGAFLRGAAAAPAPFSVGKGHTIQISKAPASRFLLADYLSFRPGRLHGLANNDTISRVDPNLPHSSWVAVFIALNNALNDLFLNGVWKGIEVHPTYDSPDGRDLPRIREAFARYAERMRPIDLEFREAPPIGFGVKAIGATVIGRSARGIPRNQNLREGQVILATRPVGDLAPLTEVLIRQASGEDASAFEALRRRVLSEMLVPNVEAARIIEARLPMKGDPFDPARHVTCARDMSGPGLLALEELAQDSGADVYLHDVRFHDERLAETPMDNPTSGTNGAILIACAEGLHARIARDLAAAGCRPWIAGYVLGRSDSPSIEVNEELRRFRFLRGGGAPFFARSRFVPAQRVPEAPWGWPKAPPGSRLRPEPRVGQHLSSTQKEGVFLLRFRHRIAADAYSTPAITSDLESAVDLSTSPSVVLDLANLEYASSAFLGTLLGWHQKAAAAGAKVRLCGAGPKLLEIFRIVNIDKLFPIDADADASLKALRVAP